jgi:hypothetical protein
MASHHRVEHRRPGRFENRRAIRRPALSLRVKKVEGDYRHTAVRQSAGNRDHEAMTLVGPRAVRQHQERSAGTGGEVSRCGRSAFDLDRELDRIRGHARLTLPERPDQVKARDWR